MRAVEEIVHIVPLGHEIDRAVKPFDKLKANKVYLLTTLETQSYQVEMVEKQSYFLDAVKNKLENKGIEICCRYINMFNILEVMKTVSEIILTEKSHNNLVYVNMSSAGRLTSVGATLAAMVHGAIVYYVVADGYAGSEAQRMEHGLSICNKAEMVYLENFQLSLPSQVGLIVLVNLCLRGGRMKTKEILDVLRESGAEGFEKDYTKLWGEEKRKIQQRYLMQLNRGVLDKLEDSRYIKRERKGRYNTIEITESGKYVAHVSGLLR